MAHEEQFGTRDRSYSAWHRRNSTRRFVGIERAQTLAMIDLDASLFVEYDDGSKEPLALIETAMDLGQAYKPATVTERLAVRANIPCYVLLYKLANTPNPADQLHRDILAFRYMRLHPKSDRRWVQCTPHEWCKNLVRLREHAARRLDGEHVSSCEPAYLVRNDAA